MLGRFKTPQAVELNYEELNAAAKQEWKLRTFQSLAIGGAVQLFNTPATVDEWLDRMYDQLTGANNA